MADYNGYPNRATWNVSLWLNNEEPLYRELQRIVRRASDVNDLSDKLHRFCNDIWPNQRTPDDDHISECDWDFLARNEWEEREADNAKR